MKILIIKRDKIGDMLLTTPMLQHLRRSLPSAEIHLLANDYNAWVASNNPNIDRLWIYPRVRIGRKIRFTAAFKQLWQILQLRREHFDVALAAGGEESLRAIRRALRVGAKRVIAYCDDEALKNQLTDPLKAPNSNHEIGRMLGLLIPLGIPLPASPIYPHYDLPAVWHEFAVNWVTERSLKSNAYIVLGLGARHAKRQPTTQQILRWCAHFKERYNLTTVFMWTPGKSDNLLYPGDDDIAQPVLDNHVPYIHPFRGPIMPALGLIWHARTSIFPDSGFMHFAAASPGGVLGLFAASRSSPSPKQWGPRGIKADYLEAETTVPDISDAELYQRIEKLIFRRVPETTNL